MEQNEERNRLPWWAGAAGKVLIAAVAAALVAAVAVAAFSGEIRGALLTPGDRATPSAPPSGDAPRF